MIVRLSNRRLIPQFSLEKSYFVLEITIVRNVEVEFRIETESGSPVYRPSDDFELIDPRIGESWTFEARPGIVTIGPPEFLEKEFWVRYFDDDLGAAAVYRDVRDRLSS